MILARAHRRGRPAGALSITTVRGALTGAGQISHAAAMAKVDVEFEMWDKCRINGSSAVERHLAEAINATKRIGVEGKTAGQVA